MAVQQNPIRRYKDREDLTYKVLAKRLGISEDYARKLGAGLVTSVSPEMADKFERRTHGAIRFAEMMDWARGKKAPRRKRAKVIRELPPVGDSPDDGATAA